jgi:UDP-glucose 4-epimerase
MKVLVTGATGFLGQRLVADLLMSGSYELITMSKKPIFATRTKHYCCDLGFTNPDSKHYSFFHKVCKSERPDVIFHLAGNPLSRLDEQSPHSILVDNIIGTQKVLHYAPEGCRVVLASTVIVYGDWLLKDNPDAQYEESCKTDPTSVYGMTKRAAESLVEIYTSSERINGVSLRLCATIGPNLTHGVIKDFMTKLKSSSTHLEILGDAPGSTKPYCHIDDAISALKLVGFSDLSGEFNVVPDDTITIEKLAYCVMDNFNIQKPIKWLGEGANWKGDNRAIQISNEKLKNAGWNPKFSKSEDAIKNVVCSFYDENIIHSDNK